MGDAGSTLLGFNCGIMIVLFAERGVFRWLLGGLMVFALPIFDTALAMVRRWRSGRSIFAGDRSHFYDQLVDRGLSVKQVVAISYALAAFYAMVGCLAIWVRTRYVVPVYAVVGLATLLLIWRLGMSRAEPPPKAVNHAPPDGTP
jgi:UDP-GlcNAc:undecaprenyl-phosphate GlcNAc-1-phosphate transferase